MIICGIDASSSCTGVFIFDELVPIYYNKFRPINKNGNWEDNVFDIINQIIPILSEYKVEKIYMEDVPLKARNPKVLVQLGAVQGFFYGLVASFGIPIVFLNPSKWRSPMGLFDGTKEGTKRTEMKRKSIEKVNELFGLGLVWKSPSSVRNQDDIADAVLVAYSQIKVRHIGRPNSR